MPEVLGDAAQDLGQGDLLVLIVSELACDQQGTILDRDEAVPDPTPFGTDGQLETFGTIKAGRLQLAGEIALRESLAIIRQRPFEQGKRKASLLFRVAALRQA